MDWFKRIKPGLKPQDKKNIPDGVWLKCDGCGEVVFKNKLAQNNYVCTKCNFHFRIRSNKYIELLLDKGSFKETDFQIP